MRQQTPKVERTGVNAQKKKPPRIRFRDLYVKRYIKGMYPGQPDSIAAKRSSFKR